MMRYASVRHCESPPHSIAGPSRLRRSIFALQQSTISSNVIAIALLLSCNKFCANACRGIAVPHMGDAESTGRSIGLVRSKSFFGVSMTLKLSFIGAAACVALTSFAQAADMQPVLKAPSAVEQQATGYVEVYSGWASLRATEDGDVTRLNGWALGGAGRGNYWVSRDVSVQVDAQAEGTSYSS